MYRRCNGCDKWTEEDEDFCLDCSVEDALEADYIEDYFDYEKINSVNEGKLKDIDVGIDIEE